MTASQARASADRIVSLIESTVDSWFVGAAVAGKTALDRRVIEKVRVDVAQWDLEDEIRRADIEPARFVEVKRSIDAHNLSRHAHNEAIDDLLWRAFRMSRSSAKELVSETPGMMIDRLSVLALRRRHSARRFEKCEDESVKRTMGRNQRVLEAQWRDLTQALRGSFASFARGARRFAMYRQLKMYGR